jgi:hypothetical protein
VDVPVIVRVPLEVIVLVPEGEAVGEIVSVCNAVVDGVDVEERVNETDPVWVFVFVAVNVEVADGEGEDVVLPVCDAVVVHVTEDDALEVIEGVTDALAVTEEVKDKLAVCDAVLIEEEVVFAEDVSVGVKVPVLVCDGVVV